MDITLLPILIFLHILLAIALFFISNIFKLKGKLINKFFLNKIIFWKFLTKLIFLLVFLFLVCLKISPGLIQIVNFVISFTLIFEVCIKIANSPRFINWIGEGLEKSFRLLIMFVISLNCTYFFTRITYQVIKSYGI